MEVLNIPGPRAAHSSQITTLAGSSYVLQFDWVQRWGRWVLGLYTSGGSPLVVGQPVVVGVDLLGQYRADPRVPQGALVAVDQTGASRDPGWSDFSRGHVLLFLEDPTNG